MTDRSPERRARGSGINDDRGQVII